MAPTMMSFSGENLVASSRFMFMCEKVSLSPDGLWQVEAFFHKIIIVVCIVLVMIPVKYYVAHSWSLSLLDRSEDWPLKILIWELLFWLCRYDTTDSTYATISGRDGALPADSMDRVLLLTTVWGRALAIFSGHIHPVSSLWIVPTKSCNVHYPRCLSWNRHAYCNLQSPETSWSKTLSSQWK